MYHYVRFSKDIPFCLFFLKCKIIMKYAEVFKFMDMGMNSFS